MAGQSDRSAGPRIRVSLEIEPRRVGMPPKLVYIHILYTRVWWGVVGSNIEALGVFRYTHAHALMALTHTCSGLGFLWKSSTRENGERIWANTCYYLLLCHNQIQSKIKVH
jgi:hypothetical protein